MFPRFFEDLFHLGSRLYPQIHYIPRSCIECVIFFLKSRRLTLQLRQRFMISSPPDLLDQGDIKAYLLSAVSARSQRLHTWYQTWVLWWVDQLVHDTAEVISNLGLFCGHYQHPGPGDAEPYWRQVASLPRRRWCPPTHPPTPTSPFSPKTHPASPFSWDPVHLPHYSVYWIPCSLLFILYIRSNLTLSSESGIQPYKNWNVSLQSNEEI